MKHMVGGEYLGGMEMKRACSVYTQVNKLCTGKERLQQLAQVLSIPQLPPSAFNIGAVFEVEHYDLQT